MRSTPILALIFSLLTLSFAGGLQPMEAITNYNVIMVHGASDHWNGLDCDASDYGAPYDVIFNDKDDSLLTTIGGISHTRDIFGVYPEAGIKSIISKFIGLTPFADSVVGVYSVESKSSATGMISKLANWLRSDIFGDTLAVYLQRPFTNPANSPAENGKELGATDWKGTNKCAERRSLIEEAQEVKAKGRAKFSLPPSRNIIISHSMGGVASREYVQGDDYNDDVDKVITLDSPHEGTGALNLLNLEVC